LQVLEKVAVSICRPAVDQARVGGGMAEKPGSRARGRPEFRLASVRQPNSHVLPEVPHIVDRDIDFEERPL